MGSEKREVLIDQYAPAIDNASNKRIYTRRFVLHKLRFELTGNLVVGVKDATLNEDGILRLLKKLSFTLFGDTTPFAVNGRSLHRTNSIINSDRERVSQPAVTVGTNAFRASWDMKFTMDDFLLATGFKLVTAKFRGREIKEPSFDTRLGVASDVATPGGGGTVALSALNFNVYATDEDIDIGENEVREEIEEITDLVVATTAAGTVDIRDNNKLRRLGFLARDNGTGLLADDVIDEIQLVRNTDQIIRQYKWADLQVEMKKLYSMSDTLFSDIGKGWAMIQLDREADLSGIIDSSLSGGTKTLQVKIIPAAGKTALVTVNKEVILARG